MSRPNLNDLLAFAAVASEGSFTRAAAKLGTSQSALSVVVGRLEERTGVRLLTRTTRSVSMTEAGERLYKSIGPKLDEIEADLAALNDLRDKPAGTIRITTVEGPVRDFLLPRLTGLLKEYPDIRVEVVIDYGLTDIAAERFDAGIRVGESVEKDMISVRIGPDERLIVVGAPNYFAEHDIPRHPKDLVHHNCINLRLPTRGNLYAWEFEKDGEELRVRVDGQWTFNGGDLSLRAAIAGAGLAFLPDHVARPQIDTGELVQVLDDWCPWYPGPHLYFPSRRQRSPAFALVVDALRYSEAKERKRRR
jgi:DNA-binding transcriptional LysR family regulator